MSDIWGDIFEQPKIKAPKAVVEEWIPKIEDASKKTVTGTVAQVNTGNNSIMYAFSLVSSRNNYQYRLFNIAHEALFYPCLIALEGEIVTQVNRPEYYKQIVIGGFPQAGFLSQNEEELVAILDLVMRTARVKQILRAIYSME
jgi:hypothetical protein